MPGDALEGLLACPACADRPKLNRVEQGWSCPECGRIYPVVNGIPFLTVEDALLPNDPNTKKS